MLSPVCTPLQFRALLPHTFIVFVSHFRLGPQYFPAGRNDPLGLDTGVRCDAGDSSLNSTSSSSLSSFPTLMSLSSVSDAIPSNSRLWCSLSPRLPQTVMLFDP